MSTDKTNELDDLWPVKLAKTAQADPKRDNLWQVKSKRTFTILSLLSFVGLGGLAPLYLNSPVMHLYKNKTFSKKYVRNWSVFYTYIRMAIFATAILIGLTWSTYQAEGAVVKPQWLIDINEFNDEVLGWLGIEYQGVLEQAIEQKETTGTMTDDKLMQVEFGIFFYYALAFLVYPLWDLFSDRRTWQGYLRYKSEQTGIDSSNSDGSYAEAAKAWAKVEAEAKAMSISK